ncbi:MAG: nitronate monooxygenase family protein [Candidatus Omnitrophota bacterium]
MSHKLTPLRIGDLEIKIPIVQGAMGVMVSRASLASAVANCGGAGTIASVGLGYGTEENETNFVKASREGLEREIRRAKELTKGIIGVNILVALSNYEDLVRASVKAKADFIISGAGLPLRLPEFANSSAIKLIPIVSSARAVDIIIKSWKKRYNRLPDAIVVEGPLAGGHLGFKTEELKTDNAHTLEKLVIDVLKIAAGYEKEFNMHIPVIAAGGIFNGEDVVRFLRLGAKGVQIATRFVATLECDVAEEFKQLYLKTKNEDVFIIQSPVGMPGRAIKTKFTEKILSKEKIPVVCRYRCLKTCDPASTPYCIMKALVNAACGRIDEAVVFSGHNVYRVDKIISVKELIDSIIKEAEEELEKTSKA